MHVAHEVPHVSLGVNHSTLCISNPGEDGLKQGSREALISQVSQEGITGQSVSSF